MMKRARFTDRTVIVVSKDQVSCDLGDEAAILHLKKGVYYGLDPIGARIWQLIQKPKRLETVRDTLLDEYEVTRRRCDRDLRTLLRDLARQGLIEVRDE